MAGPPPRAPQTPGAPTRLNGWKEIAAYLNRGVRTVQRWEKDFGLPVRRFGAAKAESVWASPAEIDAWLESALGLQAKSGGAAADGDASQAAAPPPAVPRRRAGSRGTFALAATLGAVLLWLGWTAWQSARSPAPGGGSPSANALPAHWLVDVDTLVVSSARGDVLWRYQFPFLLAGNAYADQDGRSRNLMGGIADVDGDGRREVWFVSSPAGTDLPVSSSLHLFEQDGRLRWSYQPSQTVSFGSEVFGPQWVVDRAYLTARPDKQPGRAIWAVAYHTALFPSSVQGLDPLTGTPLGTYWSNGFVTALAMCGPDGRPQLCLGAANNEHKAASLAVLDANDPNGSAPAENEKYRCTSCDPSAWPAFFVFPTPARFKGPDRSGGVELMRPFEDGGVQVRVIQGWASKLPNAVGLFTFDRNLDLASVDVADSYIDVYRHLAADRLAAPGAPGSVDPERELLPLLKWNPSARRFAPVSLSRRPERSAPSR